MIEAPVHEHRCFLFRRVIAQIFQYMRPSKIIGLYPYICQEFFVPVLDLSNGDHSFKWFCLVTSFLRQFLNILIHIDNYIFAAGFLCSKYQQMVPYRSGNIGNCMPGIGST